MKDNGICETCRHNQRLWMNNYTDRFCTNCESEEFARNTEYLKVKECKEWEARDGQTD